MNRRRFLHASIAASAAALLPAAAAPAAAGTRKFRLRYAPHFKMFEAHAGTDLLAQLRFMVDQGFTALEDNGLMKRSIEVQEQIGRTLTELGMTMGVFVLDAGGNNLPSLASGNADFRNAFLAACQTAIEVARRVNARWLTVVPGSLDRTLPIGVQTGHVIDTLRAASDILEPHGLVMVLEPLSDNPNHFLRTPDQAYALCRAVRSPACKILYDAYHVQRNQGHLLASPDLVWPEVAYIQVGDNPGRKEPGTGEINFRNFFRHLHQKGFDGIVGMEHGNRHPGREGELALVAAYVEADNF